MHARKTVAGVLDARSGEVRSVRAPTLPSETVGWLLALPVPVRVADEAGPTGYGLARACAAAGIACTVAAPFAETVARLCCLRGVGTLTALALTVELGGWARFRRQALGHFLGLTPTS